ncbi:hypothetical protein ACFU6S_10445 [Streptomyces sp. NPDC057456]|uniref:hypothetical protein n=1 Tax=Streptomyces sp. NPDC057456 TaxID=3346139 RepID=UPI0036814E31
MPSTRRWRADVRRWSCGQRTGNLSLADTDSISPGFYRLIGGVLTVAGVALLALSLILAVG